MVAQRLRFLWLWYSLFFSLLAIEPSSAWLSDIAPVQSARVALSGLRSRAAADDDDSDESPVRSSGLVRAAPEEKQQSRRGWFQSLARQAAATASAAALLSSASTGGAGAPPDPAWATPLPALVGTAAACDPTVTVWQRGDDRLLYLLGTAHISELSAQLASDLVRDVHPNAVFVELDLKRIGRLPPATSAVTKVPSSPLASLPTTTTVTAAEAETDDGESAAVATALAQSRPTRVIVPAMISTSQSAAPRLASAGAVGGADSPSVLTADASDVAALPLPSPPPPSSTTDALPPRPNWFQRKAMDFATATVANALRGMYSNLGEAGFKPGEEFAAAIRAGQTAGATIVLGDRDVEVTLRRLTQALSQTDLNQLLSPNAEFEKALAELGGGPSAAEPLLRDYDNPAEFKRAMGAYVEKLKDRDSIRKVMAQLNEVAPALVQVMLTERDAYMATGIDTLNDFECMVAVMGLAHADGVERNLQERGWKQVRPPCRRG